MLMFKPFQKYDVWRFFTYHAVHFGLWHLLLNVFLQVGRFNHELFLFKKLKRFKRFLWFFALVFNLDLFSAAIGNGTKPFSCSIDLHLWCIFRCGWFIACKSSTSHYWLVCRCLQFVI